MPNIENNEENSKLLPSCIHGIYIICTFHREICTVNGNFKLQMDKFISLILLF